MAGVSSYNIGWICALPIERAAAEAILDTEPAPADFLQNASDPNVYSWGRMGGHGIVIASLSSGVYGVAAAATTASGLLASLPHIRIGLFVGIGAGIPRLDDDIDIRLGDVVVSRPEGPHGGVCQYDLMKAKPGGECELKGFLNSPPEVLLKALASLQAFHEQEDSRMTVIMKDMLERKPKMAKITKQNPGYIYQGEQHDRFFRSDYNHVGGQNCRRCETQHEIVRDKRDSTEPYIHYGTVASGNTLVKDAATRDRILTAVGDPCLCLEMEAAGLMNNFPCLVIRGICDYADSHKNDIWQRYAAATAAAYARELLDYVPKRDLEMTQSIKELLSAIQGDISELKSLQQTQYHTQMAAHGETRDAVAEVRLYHENRDLSEERRKILDWLTASDYRSRQIDSIAQRQPGTCTWLLDSDEYRAWVEVNESETMLCPGIPGAGKTIVASTVIEDVSIRFGKNKTIGIAYLYCNFQRKIEQSNANLLSSLLKQLANQPSSDFDTVKDLYKEYEGKQSRPRCEEVLECLKKVSSSYQRVFLIVDAMDEAPLEVREKLLKDLSNLQKYPQATINIFITFRPEVVSQCREYFDNYIVREIAATNEDMLEYIKTMLSAIPPRKFQELGPVIEDIKKSILDASNGMLVISKATN